MTTPTFTTPPAAPSRTDAPATFVTRANAFVAWIVVFVGEMVAAVTWLAATAAQVATDAMTSSTSSTTASAAAAAAVGSTTYADTSTTSISFTIGAKAITLAKVDTFANGDRVKIKRRSDPNVWGEGLVSSANMAAKTMTVTFDAIDGSGAGPFTDLFVILSALEPASLATVADVWAATDTGKIVTPAVLTAAAAFQTLTDASTVAWNTATQGFNARVTLGGNRTIGAPSNLHDGIPYTLELVQDATGSRTITSWNAIWDWGAAGAPTLQTGANKRDKVFAQYNSATGKLEASFRKGA